MYKYKGINAVVEDEYKEVYITAKKITEMSENLLKLTKLLNKAMKEEPTKVIEKGLGTKI